MTYTYACPTCRQSFDLSRPMAECREPGTCPQCGQADCPKVFVARPDQIGINSRCLQDPFQSTLLKERYGGGDWEIAVRDYKRWDGPYPGASPGAELPAHLR